MKAQIQGRVSKDDSQESSKLFVCACVYVHVTRGRACVVEIKGQAVLSSWLVG